MQSYPSHLVDGVTFAGGLREMAGEVLAADCAMLNLVGCAGRKVALDLLLTHGMRV